jgi:iron complex transport system permease protein
VRRASPKLMTATGALVLLVLAFLGVRLGAVSIPGDRVLAIVGSMFGVKLAPAYRAWEAAVVLDVRMPRVATGACVGAGLALSGAALQALFKNPLADAGVLGVASGASLGAVAAIHLGLAAASLWAIPALSILGAAVTAFVVYGIASERGRLPTGALLLGGIAVGSLASALTSLVLSLSLEEYEQGRQTFRWLMGGLEARTWTDTLIAFPTTAIGAAVVMASARELDALLLGEIQASALGVDVPAVRRRLIVATSIVIGGAVAVAGIIAFVGLVVPHVLRLLVGPSHSVLLPACILFGAAFVVGTDLLCRTIAAPADIRLGVMTAAVGAPFFLYLLLSKRKALVLE